MKGIYFPILLLLSNLLSEVCKSQSNIVINGYLCPESIEQKDTIFIEKKVYTDKMELIEEITYSSQEGKLNSVKKSFDSAGKLMSKESYLFDSTYITLVEFKRNSKGDIEKQLITTKGKQYTLVHINEYGQDGKLFKSTLVPEDLNKKLNSYPNSYSIYSYDLKGNLINLKQYIDDSLILNDTYKYDIHGNRIEEFSELSPDGSSYKSTYQFNKFGKIIKQENYVDDIKVSIAEMAWNDKLPTQTILTYIKDDYKERILYIRE